MALAQLCAEPVPFFHNLAGGNDKHFQFNFIRV